VEFQGASFSRRLEMEKETSRVELARLYP
jgi:hypothetical protein